MIVLRLLRAAVLAGAGAVVTLAQLNLPSETFWRGQVPVQWAGVATLALFVCADAVRSVSNAVQASRIRDYDKDLRAALSAVVAAVVTATSAPWDEVAVHYYRRRGMLLWRRLNCVAAVLAGADVDEARHSIRPGVGVVGAAFACQEAIAMPWRDFVRTATDEGVAAWEQRPAEHRFGLRWGQLRRSSQVVGVVVSPTFAANGRPDGCLMLSGALKEPDLGSPDVRRALDDCSVVLDRLGPPPRGWWGAHGR